MFENIKENHLNETHCRCLNCGEVYKVDIDDYYHISQFCRKYCALDFAKSLEVV